MTKENSSMSDVKIVSIDINKALEAHPAFREAVAKFQEQQQEMQKQLTEMDKEQQPAAQQKMQQKLQQAGGQLQKDAFMEMKKDIEQQAEKKGYDYVFDGSTLIAGGKDITEEVINSFKDKVIIEK